MTGVSMVHSAVEVADEALAAAARDGDRDAFDLLVRRYRDMAFAYCLARLGSRDEAEDVAQEAFVRALGALGRFRVEASWAAWFLRIVRNGCNDCLRRRRVRRWVVLDETWADPGPSPETAALGAERHEELAAAVEAMPDKLRIPLLMHYAAQRTYREISLALGVPESTVIGRMAGALRFLRRRMVSSP